jgi:hypothetical protein
MLGTSNLDEIGSKDFGLYLVTNSIHGEEFEVQTTNLLT